MVGAAGEEVVGSEEARTKPLQGPCGSLDGAENLQVYEVCAVFVVILRSDCLTLRLCGIE